jgi:hypothetical protein
MYDPCTLAFSFPPYPRGKKFGERDNSFKGFLYRLKPFIGFDIWHVDPERGGTRNRTDDSCGWFDRGPGDYASAEAYVLNDKEALHSLSEMIGARDLMKGPFGHVYQRMSAANTLAATLMAARYLELRRWWNRPNGAFESTRKRIFTRRRDVTDAALDLALDPLDNLSSIDEPERFVILVAAALNRRFRPWWKHPRWHVHHWRIHFDLARNLRRMFERCGTCKKRLDFGYCPSDPGDGTHHHGECLGKASARPA